MPRETGNIVGRMVVAKIVEEEERVELLRFAETEGTLLFDAGAFDGGLGLGYLFHSSE